MSKRVALIGAGRIGTIHAQNVAAQPGLELTCVVDVNSSAAAKLAGLHGAAIGEVHEVLASTDIDALIIASSTDTHAELIVRAAGAGKAIFCEKPVDLDAKRAREAIKAVAKAGVPLLIGFNRRFDPHFSGLKDRIEEGSIGTVEMIHITSRDPSPPPLDYVKSSGGLFKDMMIHDFDMARWLLGEPPCAITAMASSLVDPAIGKAGDVDSALVSLRTATGKLCVISNSRRAVYGYDQRIEVHGSDGLVEVGNLLESQVAVSRKSGRTSDPAKHFFLERYAEAYAREAAHFAEILNAEAMPLATGADGLEALVLAEAAAESLRTQSTVHLD